MSRFKRVTATGTFTVDITVPANEIWLVKAITFIYTADANVGDRNVRVSLRVGGVESAAREVDVDIAESTTVNGLFAPNVAETAPGNPNLDGTYQEVIPEFVAQGGDVLRVADTQQSEAGDVVVASIHVEFDKA